MSTDAPRAFIAVPSSEAFRGVRDAVSDVLRADAVESIPTPDVQVGESLNARILQSLRSADLVIADLTQTDPNVMYELGVAQALGKPLVVLTRDRGEQTFVPGLLGELYFVYDPADAAYLRSQIRAGVRMALGRLRIQVAHG
jgi:nucleoside 2-deoxyribosyltransferase